MSSYSHRYSITAADMDNQYRLTHGAVLLYYQDCWARMMSCSHLAAFDVIKQRKIWVITEFHCHFSPETALWSEDIDLEVWNSELTPLRVYSDFRLKCHGAVVAQGYGCWNLLNADSKRIERCDGLPDMPESIGEMTLGEHRKIRFDEGGELVRSVEHRVNNLDLDFNGHVNNRSYLGIAMLTAPEEFLRNNSLEQMHIQWVRETFLGDTITCELRRSAGGQTYTHLLYKGGHECVAKIASLWLPKTRVADVSEILVRS